MVQLCLLKCALNLYSYAKAGDSFGVEKTRLNLGSANTEMALPLIIYSETTLLLFARKPEF